nr:reverse transcriptase domain-containing protein [Tanacetum cinerariifolium]
MHPTNNESIKDVQPSVVPTESPILNSEPVIYPIIEPVASPVSASKPNQRPSILYPSRLHDQKLRDKANDQREIFFQIFKDLNLNISFANALILMPKFGPSIKSLLTNKDKLCELTRTLLNEHCSTVLVKKLPEKLGDPDKFLILCDFPRMAECLALADIGESINLMPLSVWNKLSLPDLSPTCMTLDLFDRSISRPVGVAEDIFVKVGTFHFPADFVVIDFNVDPQVPLILGRSFLKTERVLIDVFEGELTLRVGKEAITFNLDQTSRYSANYNDMTANRIDIIDIACEEYSQEVLAYQAPAYQAPIYQDLVYQPQIPQPQVVKFTNFMKANDVILKNMQTNMTSLTNSNLELKNMFGQFMKMNTASSSGSGTLPGNTITNHNEDLKGITTRSGTAYPGPTIPTTSSSPPPVVERETEAIKVMVHPANNESIEDIHPLVIPTESPIPNSEPVISPLIEPVASPVSAPRPNQKPSISYPSRLHDQKLCDKANDQREKFFQIFKDLNFNISFTDALILMPKFGPSIKSLLTNKDKLCELARIPLNEHFLAVLLKKFPEKLGDPCKSLIPCDFPRMAECLALANLELADRSISHPVRVAEDVFIKVGTFHFPTDFVVVDFDADPRVPLILKRSFLKTRRALIYVFEEGDDKFPFIIVKYLSVEEKTALITVLKSHKRAIAWKLFDIKGIDPEFYTQKILMEEDFELAVQHHRRVNPKIHDVIKQEVLKLLDAGLIYPISDNPLVSPVHYVPKKGGFTVVENEENELILTCLVTVFRNSFQTSLSHLEKMLKKCEDTNLCLNWEKSHFMVKEGIVLDHKISKEGIEVEKAKVDVITKLPHPTTVKVLGQRQEMHLKPIHYASKTMTEEESNYTTMEKEMLAVVYAFEKFRSYLIMNKSIVYTDHFTLKYLFAKKDSKARLLHWVLLLQEFTFKVIDTKGAENLATDHLSRLENPHQNVLDPK